MSAASATRASARPRAARAPAARPPLEVGWILDAGLEEVDRRAAVAARRATRRVLAAAFPDFAWSLPLRQQELLQAPVEEPVRLLEAGWLELSVQHWDFALLVTGSDLRGRDLPAAAAVASQALGVGVLSTFRLDPRVRERESDDSERRRTIERGLLRNALHVLTRLGGERADGTDPASGARGPATRAADLLRLEAPRRRSLERAFARAADERVEEELGRGGRLRFHLRAAWRNRRAILGHVVSSRSWEFPFRMGRLTTAALSALALLMVTAEAWQVALTLAWPPLVVLGLAATSATAVYVLRRQRLLSLHRSLRLTEQVVVARVAVSVFVVLGVLATYALLLAIGLTAGALLVHADLLSSWTGGPVREPGWSTYAAQAGLAASLAILVGALGASFEGESYVGHIAYVDEELPASAQAPRG